MAAAAIARNVINIFFLKNWMFIEPRDTSVYFYSPAKKEKKESQIKYCL